uniref:FCH and mu domain containing endocytic adaptor 1 n=1 Tax=Stegastes partitus TaxID=144197 RepID=A0A3B5AH87_9TELE
MKHGQLATKELAEFVRERAAIEETYSKSMNKLAKMASNGSPQGTFAPMWDVFRVSSDKLALCHLELMKKMNDLIRDINKYGDEQVKIHRKTKEEMVGTVEAVQALQVQSGHLQKSKEGYHAKCVELDRLRKEGAPQKELEKAELKSKKAAESFALCIEKYNRVGGEFEQKMSESAQQKFQEIEEAHLRQMKQLIKGYSHSIEDTHVQVGQVHEEFKQNVENIGIDNLIQKFAEQKGTGKDRPALVGFEEYMTALAPEGGKKSRAKAFRIPGLVCACTHTHTHTHTHRHTHTQTKCSTSSDDSDFDDEEPKKFHIQIRPVASSNRSSSVATEKELKATVGTLTLPPNRGTRQQVVCFGLSDVRNKQKCTFLLFASSIYAAFSSDSSSPENVEDSGLDSPSHQPLGPSPEPVGWAAWPPMPQSKEQTQTLGRPVDPFLSAFRDPSPGRSPHQQDDPASVWSVASSRPSRVPPEMDPASMRFPAFSQSLPPPEMESSVWNYLSDLFSTVHLSRGPSPISLSTQEAWPVAAAITEYINAYFKGGQHNRCLVKITGDLTMSFPAGITRIFTANPNVPVLSFRLVNISRIDHFLPNQKLLYSDPSQSDPDTRDFWFNMQALQLYLQREAELNPQASYYNVGLLKYQTCSASSCCHYTVSQPPRHPQKMDGVNLNFFKTINIHASLTSWLCVPGSGTLCASWQCLEVPRGPPPSLAVQFVGSGASLSGMDVELVGSRYRMSLVKKRFATGDALNTHSG